MHEFGRPKQNRAGAAPEASLWGVFPVPAPQDDCDETPRMVVAVRVLVRGVELVEVDIAERRLEQLVSGEFFADLGPAYFFMWNEFFEYIHVIYGYEV